MAYLDEMALEREKSKQAMIAGKQPLLGDNTTAALHELGVSLGLVPKGAPVSETAKLAASLIGPPKSVKVDEAKPLQVQPLVGRTTATLQQPLQSDDSVGNAITGGLGDATNKALQRILQQERNKAQPQTQQATAQPAQPNANIRAMSTRGRTLTQPQEANPSGAKVSASANLEGVDPKAAQAAKEWSQVYHDQGGQYSVTFTSGKRAGDPREHGRGNAFDMQLVDKKTGKPLENYRTNDPATFKAYQDYANGFHQYLEANYPDLAARHRWGGYFSGDRSKYGSLDQMHHDFAGDRIGMAGGSWKDGLSPQQAKLFPGLVPGGGLAGKPPMAAGKPAARPLEVSKPAAAGAAPTPVPAAGTNGAVSLHSGTHPDMATLQNTAIPAGDRFNNPFNMWHDGYADVHGGKPGIKISDHDTPAVYANKEAGAAAAIQKMAQSPLYSGKTMQDMIGTWVGHGQSYAPIIEQRTGISRNTPITPEFLASPDGLKFLKAMARYETDSSKEYGLTDAQWDKARKVALSNPPALGNSIPPKAAPTQGAQNAPASAPPPSTPTPQAAPQAAPQASPQPPAVPEAPPVATPQVTPQGEATPKPITPAPAAAAAPAVAAPAPAAPQASSSPPPAKPAPQVNPAHALLDTSVYELAKKSSASEAAQVKMFLGDKMTFREAMKHPMYGGMATSKARENLGKAGITPQQFDQAVKEGPPKPGKHSDVPVDPSQQKVRYAQADTGTMSDASPELPADDTKPTLDPASQPAVQNADGSISTVRTIGMEDNGKEVNIPTVPAEGGRIMSNDEAFDRYKRTGNHLGKFDTVEQAGASAEALHQDEANSISEHPKGPQPPSQPPPPSALPPELAQAFEGVFKDQDKPALDTPPPAEALPVLPAQPAAPMPPSTGGGLSLAPAGLSSIPTGALAGGAPGSQGGSIAMAGMLPPIENSTFSTPLLDSTAASAPGGGMGLSPIPFQTLGSWGWGGGGNIGAGFDWGGGGGGVSMPMFGGYE